MSSAQPLIVVRPAVEPDPAAGVRSLEDAGEVFEVLSSATARSLLQLVYDGPATATDLAEAAGTSLQNAHYHLERMLAADLVTVVGTVYSAKGREMKRYGPTRDPLVLVAGDLTLDAVRGRMRSGKSDGRRH